MLLAVLLTLGRNDPRAPDGEDDDGACAALLLLLLLLLWCAADGAAPAPPLTPLLRKRLCTLPPLEAALPNVSMLVAWEWTGCLSPNYGPDSLQNTSRGLYAQYKAYIEQ